jgi:glycosyltransferase involved in cell wall biosynthesis
MKISVIVPIYNVENYLDECIQSILNQTMKDYEIILVNDKSTDNSEQIARKYSEKHTNIKLINHDNNLKQGAARNTGLKVAKGKYILFLDPDDLINDKLLEICYKKVESNHLDFVSFGYKILYEENCNCKKNYDKGFINEIIKEDEIMTGKKLFTEEVLKVGVCGSIWREMYRKSFLIENEIYFIEGFPYEDGDFYFETLMKAKRVMNIPKELYIYRKRLDSVTTRKVKLYDIKALKQMIIRIMNIIKKELNKEERLNKALRKFINNFFFIEMHLFKELELSKDKNEEIGLISKMKFEFFENYLCKYIEEFGMNFTEEEYASIGEIVNKFENKDLKINKNLLNGIENEQNVVLSKLIEKSVWHYNQLKKTPLINIPLEEEKKVIGIYGIGGHTKSMIEYYEKNISKISAELIFIDSFKGYNNETMYGYKIINVNEINKYYFDNIIISSYSFEEEMYDKLNMILNKNIPIHRFYKNNRILLFE